MINILSILFAFSTVLMGWNPVFKEREKLSIRLFQDSDPYVADWNNDGLDDLLVGFRTGNNLARVQWYENTGSAGHPVFKNRGLLKSNGKTIEHSTDCCTGACNPHVVDYNNDGYMDIIFSTYYGTLYLYKRTSNGNLVLQPTIRCSGTEIDNGYWCGPQLVDWNEDGHLDLLTAGYRGTTEKINLYLNTGEEANALHFTNSGASVLRGISSDYRQGLRIFDLNMDGKKDIVGGCNERRFYFHENVGTNASPVFSGEVNLRTAAGDIETRWWRTRICVWDWNADGTPDLIAGDQYGYLYLYLGIGAVGTEESTTENLQSTESLTVLDNPVRGMTLPVLINSSSAGETQIEFYDVHGRLLNEQQYTLNSGSNSINLDVSGLSAGVVFVRMNSGSVSVSERFLIIR